MMKLSRRAVLRGMGAAVVGLVFVMTARIVIASIRGRAALGVAVATFLLVGPLQVNTVLAIVLVLPVSVWLQRPRRA